MLEWDKKPTNLSKKLYWKYCINLRDLIFLSWERFSLWQKKYFVKFCLRVKWFGHNECNLVISDTQTEQDSFQKGEKETGIYISNTLGLLLNLFCSWISKKKVKLMTFKVWNLWFNLICIFVFYKNINLLLIWGSVIYYLPAILNHSFLHPKSVQKAGTQSLPDCILRSSGTRRGT